MHQFSIITPTYNRAHLLPNAYNSLCRQEDIDFEWIVVDDGSTDNTKELIESFNDERIKYAYQPNAGKPSAMNRGLEMADSLISVSFDSDDILCYDALKTVWSYYDSTTGRFKEGCVCVSGLCQYDNGDIIGDKFPDEYFVSDHIRYRHNKNIKGDKLDFVLTKIYKKYPYPVFENEKNIAPNILLIRLAKDNLKTIYVNSVFSEKQFLPGGLSTQNYWFMYPKGSELFYNESSIPIFKFKLQIEHTGLYIYFAKMNKKKHIYSNSLNKKIYLLGLIYCYFYTVKLQLKKITILQKINDKIKKKDNTKVFKMDSN